MLYLPLSKIQDSGEAVQAPGALIRAEGLALVRAPGALHEGVMPSMAANGSEVFVGFSLAGTSAAPFGSDYAAKVENFVVPSSGKVRLNFVPITGQVFVFNKTTGVAVATPTVNASGEVTGLTATHEVSVTYRYALTALQARNLQGDVQPGGYVGDYMSQVGVAKRGIIYTSEFNAAVDWSAATSIKLAANGQITNQAGTGAAIDGYVIALPSQEVPFLGISFSAA